MFLGKRYQLQEPIVRNSNGMAFMYRSRDIYMDREVAIKVLREAYSSDQKVVARFQREAKGAPQHSNIVPIYDCGQCDDKYYVAMELVKGTDLRVYLRSRKIFAVEQAVIIAHDIALGLSAVHRHGIVHRGVNPAHVLIGRDGSIKLTAFSMLGATVHYNAPEQAQGDEIITPAADVYALGIVMYEMLAGHTPFDGDTPVDIAMQHLHDVPTAPSQLNANIPAPLEELILRCLEKVPEMRYRDGAQLALALEMLLASNRF